MVRGPFRFVVAGVVAVFLFVAGLWASSVALESPEDPLAENEPITYTVDVGSVGRSLRFAAVAEWSFEDLARNARSGVVTSVAVEPGAPVSAGDVLYTVDLRPVVAAVGVVPAFRDLSIRSEGEDVAQLQALLSRLEFYEGEVDGGFGVRTRDAVRAWQKSLGIPDDGVVRLGDVVFVPELPARVVLSDDVMVGAPLAGGELVLRRVLDDVRFWIPLLSEQRRFVPLSAEVLVTHGDAVWEARISEAVEDELSGELSLVLEGADGGSVCADECGDVPLEGRVNFPAEVVVVREATGPVVPISAVETLADGSTVVTGLDGSQIPVSVLAASDGLAAVDGLEAGDVVVLPLEGEEP